MPQQGNGGQASQAAASSDAQVTNQLANLVPTFDPSKDDLQQYANKVSLLAEAWPQGKYTELITRLILNCSGSAFLKLQLKQDELLKNEKKSVKALIETLGGHWGRIGLEKKYEYAERALFKCVQRSDEAADSYLARADIMWTELISQKLQISDLQSYITLRGSTLSPEDKKRVLLEADKAGSGSLDVTGVTEAIKMLGAGFFQEMTGLKRSKGKTYDQATLIMEDQEEDPSHEIFHVDADPLEDDDLMEALLTEGDTDAALVTEFESAATDLIQSDEELASALNTYTEARRRLTEKFRSRGFWPISGPGNKGGKSRGKSKTKSKFQKGRSNRRSLQQRILSSQCRICDQFGHWKAECPERHNRDRAANPGGGQTALTSFLSADTGGDAMPLEFLEIPVDQSKAIDATQSGSADVLFGFADNAGVQHQFCRNRLRGLLNLKKPVPAKESDLHAIRTEAPTRPCARVSPELALFATHGCHGVVDLGATKTVIGSNLVKDLIQSLDPAVQQTLTRCPCHITFRFGNHGTLQSEQALVIPLQDLKLKIAIVPGSTPFLISNTLLRALRAVIDVDLHTLWSKRLKRTIPIELTSRGLFLLDLNQLAAGELHVTQDSAEASAETHLAAGQEKSSESGTQPKEISTDAVRTTIDEQSKISTPSSDANHQMNVTVPPPECKPPMDSHTAAVESQSPSELPKVCNVSHGTVRSPEETADQGARGVARCDQVLTERNGELHHRLRSSTSWQDIQGSLGCRSILDPVVHQPLSEIIEGVPPNPTALHLLQGGESRVGAREHSSEGSPCLVASQFTTSSDSKDDDPKVQDQATSHHVRTPGGVRGSAGPSRDGGGMDTISGPSNALTSSPRHHPPGRSHAPHGECHADDDGPPRSPGSTSSAPRSRTVSEPEFELMFSENPQESKCSQSPETCQERSRFHRLIRQFSKELEQVQQQVGESSRKLSRLDLLEVFCGPQSQLTHQAQQLGYRAKRLGLEQCDLDTYNGRQWLFQILCTECPKNVWYSPICGPWSGWSSLNASKSLEAWDAMQRDRLQHVEQIALGIVILRHQLQNQNHLHWEQPRPSLMFKLPYLEELYHYTLAVDFDMCVAGDLKDPVNQKPIRKSMTVMTTSRALANDLQVLRCPGTHEHQPIEGTIQVGHTVMNRSKYTESYPRKFARTVIKVICKNRFVREPLAISLWCTDEDLALTGDQVRKRRRLITVAKPKVSRSSEVILDPVAKRRKTGKQHGLSSYELWNQVFDQVDAVLPRVGKKALDDQTDLLSKLQDLMPDKEIRCCIGCRGSNRTIAPPPSMTKGEAPFRKSAYILRGTQKIYVEDEWENWENLSQRQLVRTSHLARINITVFARNPDASSKPETTRSTEPKEPEVNPSQPIPQDSTESEAVQNKDQESQAGETSERLTKSQQHDCINPNQGESFKQLPRHEQISILKWHKNLGHPSHDRLCTIMQQQGCRPEMTKAARELQCSVCQQQTQPKHARPGSLRDDSDFNDRIAIDGVTWTSNQGQNFHFYHVIDHATNFNVAQIAPSKTSESAIQGLIQMWLCWAGAPGELVMDAGTELNSEEFTQFLQSNNIRATTVCPEAHFQNGKAERHGAILQHMLSKYDQEHPIHNYQDLQNALWWCSQAKNACSLKRGYAPEVLVLGKHTRLPGAVSSDHLLPAHCLADSDMSQGLLFRQQLAKRETARRAFHSADNDEVLRRAMLRRSNPHRGSYAQGEWVMIWRQQQAGAPQGMWLGPMKVVVQEGQNTIWTTMTGKLYRSAPEMVRPITASEAQNITVQSDEIPMSQLVSQIPRVTSSENSITVNPNVDIPQPTNPPSPTAENTNSPPTVEISETSSQQPDQEPEVPTPPQSNTSDHGNETVAVEPPGPEMVPVPDTDDEDLICEGLYCIDADVNALEEASQVEDLAWRCEILISDGDVQNWKSEENPTSLSFVVSAAKKQKAEVKLGTLSSSERQEFDKAKQSEVQNWLKTDTVKRILRSQLSEEQILRCRWILTWKPLEASDIDPKTPHKIHKAKARLVVLGYMDPKITEIPRDSPTLNRHSKLLILQLIASMGWDLRSFDVKAAFLQGRPQSDRIIGLEPVAELREALKLKPHEVCQLTKGAYGLIDAPYLWYQAFKEELLKLDFEESPFDPCTFILRNDQTKGPDGIIGIHVDDGLCGGNARFLQKLQQLEKVYPFGAQKLGTFTFTGIDMYQHPNKAISMSQTNYIKKISPISIPLERRKNEDSEVTQEERQSLRALIGSLQYASVHTRPDLSSRLSFLQSDN